MDNIAGLSNEAPRQDQAVDQYVGLTQAPREQLPVRHWQEARDQRDGLRVRADEYARLPALDPAYDCLARDLGREA